MNIADIMCFQPVYTHFGRYLAYNNNDNTRARVIKSATKYRIM
jgi:hypothetical protein